ncbi:hypothetical protein GUJ93_ZPchr0013g33876 [Zizania palustris]|uniref:Uncharacterized protein n=1 Tax=Zizania palustris TaxID=103762 RepID=A0A8J5WVL5_ZIZPA|nr:hypothetical protein GUJ93_ZPchr0008g13478 [Zizania palustris]KAG8060237.1 hypothetical protein GUJ93_ZPchr0002g23411 [Zizania palustris]KAG8096306.1 hypothetical protein GUJ93_ZPchr0013g33876 [Zizania palustris]
MSRFFLTTSSNEAVISGDSPLPNFIGYSLPSSEIILVSTSPSGLGLSEDPFGGLKASGTSLALSATLCTCRGSNGCPWPYSVLLATAWSPEIVSTPPCVGILRQR